MTEERSTNIAGKETTSHSQRSPEQPIVEAPRVRTGEGRRRETTWLELFFDLVFIVAVDQVARRLNGPVTAQSLVGYAVLIVPVWWAWVGYVYYTDRFGTDDLSDRLLTLLQIGAALGLAVRARNALGQGSGEFALAYGVFRLILVIRYGIAAYHAGKARAMAIRFALGFGVAAAFWLVSVAVPAPARFYLWGAGFLADLGTPLTAGRYNIEFPLNSWHLQERFGNFTMIVLGEGALGVVESLQRIHIDTAARVISAEALVLGFMLWWAYFETLDGAPVEAVGQDGRIGAYLTWAYSHLPLAAGVASLAIGISHAIRASDRPEFSGAARWLFDGSAALCFAALAIINLAYRSTGRRKMSRLQALACGVAAFAILLVSALSPRAGAPQAVGLTALASLTPMAVDLWYRSRVRAKFSA